MSAVKTALIVGASRGLGLALAEEYCSRGWQVVATARDQRVPLLDLQDRFPGQLEIEQVDIVDFQAVQALHKRLTIPGLDVLFVNAGICRANELTPSQVDEKDFVDMMLTNALSPVRVVEVFHDAVKADGVIAVMSSELGSITDSAGFWALYSASKAALNMLMKAFSAKRPDETRALLLVAPGWVRTEMGGSDAALDVSESIPLVVDTLERNAGVPGLRYLDRHGEQIAW